MKFGVVVFPGSNCDDDAYYAIGSVLRQPVEFLWHRTENLGGCDAIILPGGFAYGDYLRTGALARFSPVMKSVEKFASGGGLVLGVCNGFQILCEAGSFAWSVAPQYRPAISLPPGACARGEHGHAIHVRGRARANIENADRAYGRQLFLR